MLIRLHVGNGSAWNILFSWHSAYRRVMELVSSMHQCSQRNVLQLKERYKAGQQMGRGTTGSAVASASYKDLFPNPLSYATQIETG